MSDNAVVAVRSPDQLAAFPPVVAARLLHLNIFAGLACPDADQAVPVVWRGNEHRVQIFLLEQLPEVFVCATPWSVPGLCRFHVRLINVAHSSEVNVRNLAHKAGVVSPTSAAADEPTLMRSFAPRILFAESAVAEAMAPVPAICLMNSRLSILHLLQSPAFGHSYYHCGRGFQVRCSR